MAAAPPTLFRRGNLIHLLPAGAAVALTALSLGAPGCGLTADFSGLQGGTPRSYCAKLPTQPAFCSDFDENQFPFPWAYRMTVGGEIAIDSTASASAPNSVAVQNDGSSTLDLTLRTPFPRFPAPPSTIDFAFSLQSLGADSLTDGPRLVIAAIDFFDATSFADSGADSGPTGDRYSLQLTLVQTGGVLTLALEEETNVSGACQYHPHLLADPLTKGSWTDVRITVTLGMSKTATASAWFGATQELPETPLCLSVNPTQAQIGIGAIYNSVPAAIWKNRFDNVTLDVAPSP
jgi:hypothetical protein